MRRRAVILAAALAVAPVGARGADLVIWWDEGFYAQEAEAVREIVAAFEQESGAAVGLTLLPMEELPDKITTALKAGLPPDFAFGGLLADPVGVWAFDGRLVDLTATIGSFSNLFDPEALARWMLLNGKTGQRALYALPMGRNSMHLHVWKSLLGQAGFVLEDIPKEWDAFWSFWCDEVQPAVRRATGRDDIWGVGLSMSGNAIDTGTQFAQFRIAHEADYVTREGRLVIDDPEVRRRLIMAFDSYTSIYRKGCTPLDAIAWSNIDNNKQFHAQTVVMTANNTLSIPNALKRERPEDYYENIATIEWPLGPTGQSFSDQRLVLAGRGLQGWQSHGHRVRVRPVSRGRGLAGPLPQFFRRAHAADDA